MGIGGVHKKNNSNSNCNTNPYERMEIDDRYSGLPQSPPPPPLKTKHFHRCFSSCFRPSSSSSSSSHHHHHHHHSEEKTSRPLVRSSTTAWVRSKVHELPEGFCRCTGLSSPGGWGRHQRRHSAEFRYDPLSYSLNFDEGAATQDESPTSTEQMRYRCFSSRLPASPPSDPKSAMHSIEGNEAALLRFSS